MNKKGLNILCAALILFFIPFSLSAMEYQHKLELKDMQFSWTIEGDQINIELSAKTTGWVAIGFDPEVAMQGADIVIGAVKDDKVKIEDHYADRKRGHSPDEKLGGESNVLNPEGSEADGVTTISFALKLDSGDKYDKPIPASGMSKIMFAYGAGKDSFKTRHPYRTIYELDLATGENKKLK